MPTGCPQMAAGDALKKREIQATQHFTEPPPRYSEASLVKRMEELGIGRPSTYASILQVLRDRGYVRLDKKRLVPEDKGRVLTAFLENFFARYVEYDFTASLEEQLDKVSNNEIPWKRRAARLLDRLHRRGRPTSRSLRITQVIDALDEMLAPHLFPPSKDGSDPRKCPNCENGRIGLKLGRFGGFVGCSNYPECKFTRQLTVGADGNGGGMRKLGEDPDTGLEVTVRGGRFGSYLQLGEADQGRGRRDRKAQARQPAEGRDARRRDARAGGQAACRCRANIGKQPRGRRADHRRHRPLRLLREARQDLRQPRRRRRRHQHRAQPRRHADRREAGQSRQGPPLRRRSRQAARRASAEGRPGHGQERPLRTLRQPTTASTPRCRATRRRTRSRSTRRSCCSTPAPSAPAARPSRRKRPARKEPPKKAAPPKAPEKAKKRAAAAAPRPRSTRKAKSRSRRVTRWRNRRAILKLQATARFRARAGISLTKPTHHKPAFPSKDEILAFIGERPGKIGVREIARAFNLKNDRRAELKRVLRELAGDGRVASRRHKLHPSGCAALGDARRHRRRAMPTAN